MILSLLSHMLSFGGGSMERSVFFEPTWRLDLRHASHGYDITASEQAYNNVAALTPCQPTSPRVLTSSDTHLLQTLWRLTFD